MAPLIGYFPPASAYVPADNEAWLEIQRDSKKIILYRGKDVVKEVTAEGEINIGPGEFYLQLLLPHGLHPLRFARADDDGICGTVVLTEPSVS